MKKMIKRGLSTILVMTLIVTTFFIFDPSMFKVAAATDYTVKAAPKEYYYFTKQSTKQKPTGESLSA